MKFISMQSHAGKAPIIIVDLEPGESCAERDTVEGGTGVVTIVTKSSASIRCVDVVVPDAQGFVLARRARRRLLRQAVDAQRVVYSAIDLDPKPVDANYVAQPQALEE